MLNFDRMSYRIAHVEAAMRVGVYAAISAVPNHFVGGAVCHLAC